MLRLGNGKYVCDTVTYMSIWAFKKEFNIVGGKSNGLDSSAMAKNSEFKMCPTELNTPWKTVRCFPLDALKTYYGIK